MTTDLRGVNLAVDEAKRLLDKMDEDTRHSGFAEITALAFGMLKAIMECPNCPGHFRVPCAGYEKSWEWIICCNCSQVWHCKPDEAAPR